MSHESNMHPVKKYQFDYAFAGGMILPSQMKTLMDCDVERLRIGSFGVVSLPIDAEDEQVAIAQGKDWGDALAKSAQHESRLMDISPEIYHSDFAEKWLKWANQLHEVGQSVMFPHYEIKAGTERVFSLDPHPDKRFSSLHKRTKIALIYGKHSEFGLYSYDLAFVIPDHGLGWDKVHVFAGGGGGIWGASEALAPRPADWLGLYSCEDAVKLSECLMQWNKEYGDWSNPRKRRLKSLIGVKGLDWLSEQIKTAGLSFRQGECPKFLSVGEQSYDEARNQLVVYVPRGVIDNQAQYPLFGALKEVATRLKKPVWITPQMNLLFHEDDASLVQEIRRLLPNKENPSSLKMEAMACRGFPMCKKAKASASTVLHTLTKLIDSLLAKENLNGHHLVFRISGCPNGCSRPMFAELALIGRKEAQYDLFIGGSPLGDRLAYRYKKAVPYDTLEEVLGKLFAQFAKERENESFGDWATRQQNKLQPAEKS